jgi:triosephosphate isomerase
MNRKPLIAGNWKLNKTVREAIELVTLLKRSIRDTQTVEVVVCPVFTALSEVAETLLESGIRVGAQDVFWEDKGAFTGEVSAALLKEAGAAFVIVGHSERRQYFHETDGAVNRKTRAALKTGLVPIVCVGETSAERESGKTFEVVRSQLQGGFEKFSPEEMRKLVIAYEPVWAIGTGKVATPAQAQEVHVSIRRELSKVFGAETAEVIRILYGGSVKPDNISQLMSEPDIDGALVGGASLEAAAFSEIVRNTALVAVK